MVYVSDGLEMKWFNSPTFPEQKMTIRIKYWEGGCVGRRIGI